MSGNKGKSILPRSLSEIALVIFPSDEYLKVALYIQAKLGLIQVSIVRDGDPKPDFIHSSIAIGPVGWKPRHQYPDLWLLSEGNKRIVDRDVLIEKFDSEEYFLWPRITERKATIYKKHSNSLMSAVEITVNKAFQKIQGRTKELSVEEVVEIYMFLKHVICNSNNSLRKLRKKALEIFESRIEEIIEISWKERRFIQLAKVFGSRSTTFALGYLLWRKKVRDMPQSINKTKTIDIWINNPNIALLSCENKQISMQEEIPSNSSNIPLSALAALGIAAWECEKIDCAKRIARNLSGSDSSFRTRNNLFFKEQPQNSHIVMTLLVPIFLIKSKEVDIRNLSFQKVSSGIIQEWTWDVFASNDSLWPGIIKGSEKNGEAHSLVDPTKRLISRSLLDNLINSVYVDGVDEEVNLLESEAQEHFDSVILSLWEDIFRELQHRVAKPLFKLSYKSEVENECVMLNEEYMLACGIEEYQSNSYPQIIQNEYGEEANLEFNTFSSPSKLSIIYPSGKLSSKTIGEVKDYPLTFMPKGRWFVNPKEIIDSDWYDSAYKASSEYKQDFRKSVYLPVWSKITEEILRQGYKSILDIGCGNGQFAAALLDRCPDIRYSGVDFSKVAIQKAQERGLRCEFSCQNIFDIDNDHLNSFDLVCCLEVLEHIDEDLKLLSALAAGSKLIYSVPNFDSISHVRFFSDDVSVAIRYQYLFDDFKISQVKLNSRRASIFLVCATYK